MNVVVQDKAVMCYCEECKRVFRGNTGDRLCCDCARLVRLGVIKRKGV
jgi:hypothetical protein